MSMVELNELAGESSCIASRGSLSILRGSEPLEVTESLRAMVVVERSVERNGIECEYELKMI
jgi:hypothetical protein